MLVNSSSVSFEDNKLNDKKDSSYDSNQKKKTELPADSYAIFLKKIYEPLINNSGSVSVSDYTIDSGDEDNEDSELLINISHNDS